MAAEDANPTLCDCRRFWIRLPRPLWIGMATVMLIFVGFGLRFGLPIYRRHVAIREIERVGGWVDAQRGVPEWLRKWIGYEGMQGFDNVHAVHLEHTSANDATMEHVGWLTELNWLILDSTPVSDVGLAHVRGLTKLEGLDLNDTQVTDAGLRHLKGMNKLEGLYLRNAAVSDRGLAQLNGLTRLKWVWLGNTQVTEAGVAELMLRWPGVEIDW